MAAYGTYTREKRVITIDNLSLAYGKKVIFRGINIAVDNIVRPGMSQGQVVAILGPSGIGKTQLFRCIAGLQESGGDCVISGSVHLNGDKDPVKAGDVGVVFQNYPLLRHRTIWQNLKIAAARSGRKDEEIVELMDHFSLAEMRDRYPVQLSGGQRQRVAIIQQMLCSKHFILMDEPFSGLDVVMKQRVIDLIRDVSLVDELNTFLVTTHDIETAVAIADTIWILGREKTTDGNWLPGSTIVKQYDLIERGLAWNPDVMKHHNFFPTVVEIREMFNNL